MRAKLYFIETNVAEEYCWAKTCGGRFCCGLSSSSVFEYGFQLDTRLCTYACDNSNVRKMRLTPDLPERN